MTASYLQCSHWVEAAAFLDEKKAMGFSDDELVVVGLAPLFLMSSFSDQMDLFDEFEDDLFDRISEYLKEFVSNVKNDFKNTPEYHVNARAAGQDVSEYLEYLKDWLERNSQVSWSTVVDVNDYMTNFRRWLSINAPSAFDSDEWHEAMEAFERDEEF